jgi:hypothetical protein
MVTWLNKINDLIFLDFKTLKIEQERLKSFLLNFEEQSKELTPNVKQTSKSQHNESS